MTRNRLAVLATAACSLALCAPASAAYPHTVMPGETLSSIAAANGMSAASLAAANGISPFTRVVSGATIMIPPRGLATTTTPTPASSTAAAAGDGDNDVDDGAAAGVTPVAAQTPAPPALGGHTVLPGETLSGIAARAGVSASQLAWMNGLSPNGVLVAGTALKLPTGAPPAAQNAAVVPARTVPQAPPNPTPGRATSGQIGQIAAANGVPSSLASAIAWQESGFNNSAVSSANARGVMQVMPGTWQWVQHNLSSSPLDPNSALDNVKAGVLYLHQLLNDTGGNAAEAAAAYYQGLGSVRAHGLLPETQRYVNNVMALRGRFGGP